MINLLTIDSSALASQQILSILPILKPLQETQERNAWHDETTYEHITAIMEQFEQWQVSLPTGELRNYLTQTFDTFSRLELLKIVILFHDLGKAETIITNPDGTTSFPDHESKSAEKAVSLLNQFSLSLREKQYILDLIIKHSLPHIILSDREHYEAKLTELKKSKPDIFIDLLTFAMLDTMGSKLRDKNPSEFEFRINQYNNWLK